MQATVLGATGGIGNAVMHAFLNRGHRVVALARRPEAIAPQPGLTIVAGDVLDEKALNRACDGSDVVFHGINLPYPEWDPGMLDITSRILAVTQQKGQPLLFPGNLYGLGPDYSEPLTEQSRHEPSARKGHLRNRLEGMLQDASARGARTIILRMGDFFGGGGESTWMHHLTAKAATGGALQYPSAMDIPHAWAYLPDAADTLVLLAERRAELEAFAVFHFEGHILTGTQWADAVRAALGAADRPVRRMPWWLMSPLRLFNPMIRELWEMRYLWDQPVRMDGSKLRDTLGPVPHTPLEQAMHTTLNRSPEGTITQAS